MGDLLMSSPAIRAVKESTKAHITVLTSSMGADIATMIDCIDDVITFDFPWVKLSTTAIPEACFELITALKQRAYDAVIIFTVYSQNPLPAAMLAYLAEIPIRLAYCRENPYGLLSHWIPDPEPYQEIVHQVVRDLRLVNHLGFHVADNGIRIAIPSDAWSRASKKMLAAGADPSNPYIVLHPGVSEEKRAYPKENWLQLAKHLQANFKQQLVFTAGNQERSDTDRLARQVGINAYSLAGQLLLDELAAIIDRADLLISVNTGVAHIASATATPLIVLYALTNPQHAPWKAKGKVLPYSVSAIFISKNDVIRYVNAHLLKTGTQAVTPDHVLQSAKSLLQANPDSLPFIPPIPDGFLS